MKFIVGFVAVIGCVLGGYVMADGHIEVLWQPLEFLIIFGGGLGAFAIANPAPILKGVLGNLSKLIKGPAYKKSSYLDILAVLYSLFKLAKSKGDLALEGHVENPHDSAIFNQFPSFAHDHHALEFLCDYLRMLTLGVSNPHEVADIMDVELENHHEHMHAISAAMVGLGEGLPALGIVAAVLGVIHTMGSISEPPEILGHLIGAALVGTFSGILFSYGFVTPMGQSLGATFTEEGAYFACMKAGVIAHMQGYAPQVSIEFARKTIPHHVRPTFKELEDALSNIGNPE
ncbi:MAG: flagellar motor stator protein MotA [Alphaproteobacteria bacterium]|nr:flagellar motor stator protein MotA [Alphaproteobacteria bacterium]MBF0249031.1 flagellar motor stator protein MotA [Alphaproteobacteria bacterium]